MASAAEFPTLQELNRRELAAAAAGAVATAGAILGERAADCVIDFQADAFDAPDGLGYSKMSVDGLNGGSGLNSFVLFADHPHGTLRCGLIESDGVLKTRRWLDKGPDGEILLVSDQDEDEPVPTTLHDGIQTLLQTVREQAVPLTARPRPRPERQIQDLGRRDEIGMYAAHVLPVVANLVRDIGTLLSTPQPKGRWVRDVRVRVGVESWSERVYGLPAPEQIVRAGVQDGDKGRRDFLLGFRHAGQRGEHEVVGLSFVTRDEDRREVPRLVTASRLGRQGRQLTLASETQVGEGTSEPGDLSVVSSDVIPAMAKRVLLG